MNSEDHAMLAHLLFHGGIAVELIGQKGGVLDVYSYEYAIYIPAVQEFYAGMPLDEYDGLHMYDFEEYVGHAPSLKEAWRQFATRAGIDNYLDMFTNPEIPDTKEGEAFVKMLKERQKS